MPHRLAREAELHRRIAEDDRVLAGRALAEAGLLERLDLGREAEGPRRRDLAREGLGRDLELERAAVDARLVERGDVLERQARVRRQRDERRAPWRTYTGWSSLKTRASADRSTIPACSTRRISSSAAVEPGSSSRELDRQVVDREARAHGEQVLDRVDFRVAAHEPRAPLLRFAVGDVRRDRLAAGDVGAHELDAAVDRRRQDARVDDRARVQGRSADLHRRPQRALLACQGESSLDFDSGSISSSGTDARAPSAAPASGRRSTSA